MLFGVDAVQFVSIVLAVLLGSSLILAVLSKPSSLGSLKDFSRHFGMTMVVVILALIALAVLYAGLLYLMADRLAA